MGLQEQLISNLQKQECRSLRTPNQGTNVIANSSSKIEVLVLLDDVHDFEQIEPSVGNLRWLGSGSSIHTIVGRKDVLICYGDGVVHK